MITGFLFFNVLFLKAPDLTLEKCNSQGVKFEEKKN